MTEVYVEGRLVRDRGVPWWRFAPRWHTTILWGLWEMRGPKDRAVSAWSTWFELVETTVWSRGVRLAYDPQGWDRYGYEWHPLGRWSILCWLWERGTRLGDEPYWFRIVGK